MQDIPFTLPTPDGFTIYGIRNGELGKPAILLIPGLTSHMHEYTYQRAMQLWLPEFCVYRVNLYDGRSGSRLLHRSSLATHATDTHTVLDWLTPHHPSCFGVGHSLGGITLMLANDVRMHAVSLWDPSYGLGQLGEMIQPLPGCPDHLAITWGTTTLVSPELKTECQTYDEAACQKLSESAAFPIQTIFAAGELYVTKPASYHTHCPYWHEAHIVAGTEHCFHENQTSDEAANLTARWFNRWLQA